MFALGRLDQSFMSRKTGKKYTAASKQVEQALHLEEAVPLVKKIKFAKFDETVELHMRLGVDPKHADQMVRGTVVLPNGLGKSKKVLVIASGDKLREADQAGADLLAAKRWSTKIQSENWTDYDAVIATPDMMRSVGRLGKVLGPRGLMPNPKTGTVTDRHRAGREGSEGRKSGISRGQDRRHPCARWAKSVSKRTSCSKIPTACIQAVIKAKPAAAKGKYVKSVTICSTMGPGVHLGRDAFQREAALSETIMKKKPDKEKDIEALKKELGKGPEHLRDGL